MKTLREFIIALWYLAIPTLGVVGTTVGVVNGYKALNDPAGTMTDVATYGGGPAAAGIIGAILLGVLHWIPHAIPVGSSAQVPTNGNSVIPPIPVARDVQRFDLSLPPDIHVTVTVEGKADPQVVAKVREALALAAGGGK